MRLIMRIGSIALSAGLLAGCASKSDLTNIQTQIDGLKAEQASIRSTAEQALSSAQAATTMAANAEAAANRAASAAQAASAKLDEMMAKGTRGRHASHSHSHSHGSMTHSHAHTGDHHH